MCFLSLVTRFLIVVGGILVPARHTHNALGNDQQTAWAKYWIVYGFLVCLELLGDVFLNWLPLYVESKLLIVLWLVISAPLASVWIFDVILNPLLVHFMPNFDHFLLYGKRRLLNDALTCSSQLIARSVDTIVPVVSYVWKKPNQFRATDDCGALDVATKVNTVPCREPESSANPQRTIYFDPTVDNTSIDESASFTQLNALGLEQPRPSKISLPERAPRVLDKGKRPSTSRLMRKQFMYSSPNEIISLNTDPLSGMEDLLKKERAAVEFLQRPLPPRKDIRRRYQ